MKKTHNERNAGRKKKYNVPVKLIRVPEPILSQVNELSKPYENVAKESIAKEHKKFLRFNKLK
jgi:hypothetical protein